MQQPHRLCAALLLFLVAAVAAESVRETETMDPKLYAEEISGDLPDDEDSRLDLIIDEEDDYEVSGSGDRDDIDTEDPLATVISPEVSLDNFIPGDNKGTKDINEPAVIENDIVVGNNAASPEEDLSNKISMASTANGSIFERTEVLAALIAGGAVGLLFAVFLILLLVYRMKKKDEGSYDLGKKPIYKKAPTNEFYA
ncbi:syndecan-4 [Tiliqua scincoides]|uniref:syndecan-4 n=1 Tax=Tiliqua scincoides TaxID=71010 RepID=UPI0034633BFF